MSVLKSKREVYTLLSLLRSRRGDSWVSRANVHGEQEPDNKNFYAGVLLRKGGIVVKLPKEHWQEAVNTTLSVLPRAPGALTKPLVLIDILKDNIK
jgi:hypothetical protein